MITEIRWYWLILATLAVISTLTFLWYSAHRFLPGHAVIRLHARKGGTAPVPLAPSVRTIPALPPGHQFTRIAGILAPEQHAIRLPDHKTFTINGSHRRTTMVFPLSPDIAISCFWYAYLGRGKEISDED